MLEVGELGAGAGRGGFARVEDFGAEFGAGGAEEVGFLRVFVTEVSLDVYGFWGWLGRKVLWRRWLWGRWEGRKGGRNIYVFDVRF